MLIISHTHYFPVTVRKLHTMRSVEKGYGIVAVVHSRQVVTVHGSSDRCFQCSFGRDFGLWLLETGGRSIQVVVNTGFTVYRVDGSIVVAADAWGCHGELER